MTRLSELDPDPEPRSYHAHAVDLARADSSWATVVAPLGFVLLVMELIGNGIVGRIYEGLKKNRIKDKICVGRSTSTMLNNTNC